MCVVFFIYTCAQHTHTHTQSKGLFFDVHEHENDVALAASIAEADDCGQHYLTLTLSPRPVIIVNTQQAPDFTTTALDRYAFQFVEVKHEGQNPFYVPHKEHVRVVSIFS